ncbi:MAG TPA: serine/threonine-protein kinase, partial [Vicinamibacterales bacterium]|nr:serine/threonine-protein kinase [Vicinamibacterales bacterium]
MPAIGTSFGPYRVVAPLGAGGMGEVYRAHDPRLRRDVALKLLPAAQAGDADAVARMVRESRLVAALNHPGIITIHDVGEESGAFYLVTELIEGETLRARLTRGMLPVRQAVDISTAIVGALAAAHARGVVHRDLKPENVMLTATGDVKVLDFGIAKSVALPDATTGVGPTQLTAAGVAIGTPSYMAPEQLAGTTVDHRSDQFALGVLLFEMVTGTRPFKGATTAELSASILRDEPPLLTVMREGVPPPLARIVARCMAKTPEQRYASTQDLEHALADVRADFELLSTPRPPSEPPQRPVRVKAIAAVVAVIAVAAVVVVGWPRDTPSSSATVRPALSAVAVLPFTTLGEGEPYLADGITEAVTRELGHIEGARVIAATSTFAYRGKAEAIGDVGRELGVGVVVRGSVQRVGDRLRVTASLVNAADAVILWNQSYERGAGDVLAVQDDIAWQVANKMAAALGVPGPPRPPNIPRTSPEAYDAYLRGL